METINQLIEDLHSKYFTSNESSLSKKQIINAAKNVRSIIDKAEKFFYYTLDHDTTKLQEYLANFKASSHTDEIVALILRNIPKIAEEIRITCDIWGPLTLHNFLDCQWCSYMTTKYSLSFVDLHDIGQLLTSFQESCLASEPMMTTLFDTGIKNLVGETSEQPVDFDLD